MKGVLGKVRISRKLLVILGGTAVLIAVGVTLDTASQIESYILAKNYESFMSRSAQGKTGPSSAAMRSRVLKR